MSAARPAWVRRAMEAAARWVAAAPAPLAERLARVHATAAGKQGAASVEGALTSAFATPGLALMEAHRADLGLPEEGLIDAVAEGALALYFYLRVQDDVIDEPGVFDPTYLFAAEVFAGASAEAFARAVGHSPAFWALRRAILDEMAAAGAWEIDVYRRMDPAEAAPRAEQDARRLGSKLVPMAVPLAALAAAAREAAGEERALAWVGPFARELGAALQIANDLLNARDDHAAGRLTPALALLYSSGRLARGAEAHRVWPVLAGDPALGRMVTAARAHLDAAAACARGAGAHAVAEVAASRARTLDEIGPRLLALALGVAP